MVIKRPKNSRWPLVFVCALLALGGAGAVWMLSASKNQPAPSEVITYSTDKPSEAAPSVSYEWRGGAEEPKRIIVPSIGVDGFIQKVGVDQHGQIAVPDNIHMAGWFVDSVKPGQKGLSIIDGHVDGRQTEGGIFKDVSQMQPGDTYHVEFGDGSMQQFKVTRVVTTTMQEAPGLLFSQEPGVIRQLNLITCGGTFDTQAKTYDKRVIVVSEAIEG